MEALSTRGAKTASGDDGRIVLNTMPSGSYEFWPAGPIPPSTPAPLRMNVLPGENSARMTFARAVSP